ncbi:hypothetical protein, partial [Methylocapsa sp. S129]|uniref:hypothetical protein n=1 Tax=Methylocapsa sp. S129 TaxID=1641869 RepID=UPI001AEDF1EE
MISYDPKKSPANFFQVTTSKINELQAKIRKKNCALRPGYVSAAALYAGRFEGANIARILIFRKKMQALIALAVGMAPCQWRWRSSSPDWPVVPT